MKVGGSYTIDSPRERVWESLQDPVVLSGCIPGCREFTPVGTDEYAATLRVGIGVIAGVYDGTVRVAGSQRPSSLTLAVEGKGSAGTTVRGEGTINLTDAGESTAVTVEGDAHVTGPIARVGQRLLGTAARTLMNQFFDCVKSELERA